MGFADRKRGREQRPVVYNLFLILILICTSDYLICYVKAPWRYSLKRKIWSATMIAPVLQLLD